MSLRLCRALAWSPRQATRRTNKTLNQTFDQSKDKIVNKKKAVSHDSLLGGQIAFNTGALLHL